MKKRLSFKFLNTIGFKVSLIYISLAVINIAFFTSIIFENQVDLVTDNAKLKAEKFVGSVVTSLKKFSSKVGPDRLFMIRNKKKLIHKVDQIIKPLVEEYIIFSEPGEILLKSVPDLTMPETYLQDGLKSVANHDFTGKRYYLKINEKAYEMYFYIPMHEYLQKDIILFIRYDIMNIGDRLGELYSQAILILIITTIFHIFFAILIYGVVVRPIYHLHKGITEISGGNFTARIDIDRHDEIGLASKAFNKMAHTLEKTKNTVEKQIDVIQEMEITDELTELYNRRYLFTRIDEEIKRTIRRDYDLSFIMIDIDNFKNFNDLHGHQIGDIVLKEVAKTIKFVCKEPDIVARYGGEEIAVIALDCPLDDCIRMSERIRSTIENTKIDTSDGMLSVTVSLGATCFNRTLRETIGSAEALIYFADTALYRAKQKGRNRVEIG